MAFLGGDVSEPGDGDRLDGPALSAAPPAGGEPYSLLLVPVGRQPTCTLTSGGAALLCVSPPSLVGRTAFDTLGH